MTARNWEPSADVIYSTIRTAEARGGLQLNKTPAKEAQPIRRQ